MGGDREGGDGLSEREIFARERAEGRRVFSAALTGPRFHRPDLICLDDPIEAIEVELTTKATRRLDEILRAWRRAVGGGQFGRVRYLCAPKVLLPVKRSMARTVTDAVIEVEALETGLPATMSRR